jgi:hypothetical protein
LVGTQPGSEQLAGDLLFARLPSSKAVAATTWDAVLNSLEAAARSSDEASAIADIAQLRSLCDVMDNEAFLPVRIEELTNLEVPRRLIGFADLIQQKGRGRGDCRSHRSQPVMRVVFCRTLPQDRSGRGMARLRPQELVALRHYPSLDPIFANSDFGRAPFVLEALKAWAPPRLFADGGCALIPLTVLPDVARERVLEDLLEQLRRLHTALQSAAAVTISAPLTHHPIPTTIRFRRVDPVWAFAAEASGCAERPL